jgi:hypothetical protein
MKTNTGQFKKGNPGKPKGAKSKLPSQLREAITQFLEGNFQNVVKDYKKLKPAEKLKFYSELLQYSIPKLKTISTNEIENLSEEDLKKILEMIREEVKNKHHEQATSN